MSARVLLLCLPLLILSLAPAQAQRRLPPQVVPSAQAAGLRGAQGGSVDGAPAPATPADNILTPSGQAPATAAAASGATSALPASSPATTGGVAPATLSPAFAAPGQAFQAADDCRRACAASYYTCQSGAVSDDCSTQWIQCLEACRNPAPAAGANP